MVESHEVIGGLMLDRGLPVAMHYQISQGIKGLIDQGSLQPGDRLPTVKELAALCKVSLATAMRAVSELNRRGMLETKRGRGIHVAGLRAGSVQVLICEHEDTPRDFFMDIVRGLTDGYGDSTRRFSTLFLHDHVPDAPELLGAARSRRVEGYVAYRPTADLLRVLESISHELPSVAIHADATPPRVGSVTPDPAVAMGNLLSRRLARGQKHFACVELEVFQNVEDACPGNQMRDAAIDVLRKAGVELTVKVVEKVTETDPAKVRARHKEINDRLAAELPRGATVICQTAAAAIRLLRADRDFDAITFTESAATMQAARGKFAVMYMALEEVGRAAVPLLKTSAAPGANRVVRLEPKVVDWL